jgi:hypothetical protein
LFKLFKRKDAIVIFHPYVDIFSNSTMMLLMEKLVDRGERVHLYTYEKPVSLGDLANKIHFKRLPKIYPIIARRPDYLFKQTILPAIVCWIKNVLIYKVKNFLVIDQEGFLIFHKLFPTKLKFCNYVSFEIFISDEITNERQKALKVKEKESLKKGIASLLIQGKYRNALFLEEHEECVIDKTFFLPVAPPKFELNHRFSDLISIPPGKKSIVYSGSLHEWAGILEILNEFKNNWDSDFHLIIHYRFPEYENPVIKIIQDLEKNGYPITLFVKKFINTDYYNFLQQFNVALATYKSMPKSYHGIDGKNFEIIGLSSGKFNTQMMMGIPTITTKSSSFLDFKKHYNFGYVLEDFSELKNALAYVKLREKEMSMEAKKLYNEVINPELYINHYIDMLTHVS